MNIVEMKARAESLAIEDLKLDMIDKIPTAKIKEMRDTLELGNKSMEAIVAIIEAKNSTLSYDEQEKFKESAIETYGESIYIIRVIDRVLAIRELIGGEE